MRLSEIDFGVVSKQAADLKKDIKQRERGRLSADAEISLLNDRIKLLALQNEQSQIAAEKALALRALYFYAGFSPFTRTLLKNEIKDIVVSLRASFNKDMVEMLAAVPAEEAYDEKVGNDWAKKENWLVFSDRQEVERQRSSECLPGWSIRIPEISVSTEMW